MREAILIVSRVAMSLQRFGIGNVFYTMREVYGMVKSAISKIVRNFCRLVKVHLQCTFMQFPNLAQFRVLTQELKALYRIPHMIVIIDESPILILTLVIGRENDYCQKSLHSALLQDILDIKYAFWDYEFGWTGSMYDWTLLQLKN